MALLLSTLGIIVFGYLMFRIGRACGIASVHDMLTRHRADIALYREEMRLWYKEKDACIDEWKESLADEILERWRKEGHI